MHHTVEQLLERPDGGLAVVDADELCLAPRGHDLACYAANLVTGRPGDLADAEQAVRLLTVAYGRPVADLDWYLTVALLRRVDRSLRRLKTGWPQRTATHVAIIEQVLAAHR